MPEYIGVDTIPLVEKVMTSLQSPYSLHDYCFVKWQDLTGILEGYLLCKGGIVTVDVRHKASHTAIVGERMLGLTINTNTRSCSVYAKLTTLETLDLADFVTYITNEISSLGDPVQAEGAELVAV